MKIFQKTSHVIIIRNNFILLHLRMKENNELYKIYKNKLATSRTTSEIFTKLKEFYIYFNIHFNIYYKRNKGRRLSKNLFLFFYLYVLFFFVFLVGGQVSLLINLQETLGNWLCGILNKSLKQDPTKLLLYDHLPPISQKLDKQGMLSTTGEVMTNLYVTFSYGLLPKDIPVLPDPT